MKTKPSQVFAMIVSAMIAVTTTKMLGISRLTKVIAGSKITLDKSAPRGTPRLRLSLIKIVNNFFDFVLDFLAFISYTIRNES